MTSTRAQTALRHLGAFGQLRLSGLTSHDARMPANLCSCITAYAPTFGRGAFAAHLKEVLEIFPVFPKEILQDTKKNQVVL
jgi:hypothetical protein